MIFNFFGDFVAPDTENLQMSHDLISLIKSGDVNAVNCEAVAIGEHPDSYIPIRKTGPNIFQSSNSPSWLINHGFNVCSLANNHVFDYGEKALQQTLNLFPDGIVTGCGNWETAYKPQIKTIKGKVIAFLCLTHCEFGTLTDDTSPEQYGAAWINHPSVDSIIVELRKTVDFLFIFAHAGVEQLEQPLPEWRTRYRSLINLGCDAVIASHPHIVQGWEMYKGKPIVYSLGNFYFPMDTNDVSWFRSICASVIIGDNDEVSLKITPLRFSKNKIGLDIGEDAKSNFDRINHLLNDEQLYRAYIDAESIRQLENYFTMFQRGGMSRSYTLKKILRQLYWLLKSNHPYQPEWLINNLQCESHRWFYLRGMKNTFDL